jgi:hypothetical protein
MEICERWAHKKNKKHVGGILREGSKTAAALRKDTSTLLKYLRSPLADMETQEAIVLSTLQMCSYGEDICSFILNETPLYNLLLDLVEGTPALRSKPCAAKLMTLLQESRKKRTVSIPRQHLQLFQRHHESSLLPSIEAPPRHAPLNCRRPLSGSGHARSSEQIRLLNYDMKPRPVTATLPLQILSANPQVPQQRHNPIPCLEKDHHENPKSKPKQKRHRQNKKNKQRKQHHGRLSRSASAAAVPLSPKPTIENMLSATLPATTFPRGENEGAESAGQF